MKRRSSPDFERRPERLAPLGSTFPSWMREPGAPVRRPTRRASLVAGLGTLQAGNEGGWLPTERALRPTAVELAALAASASLSFSRLSSSLQLCRPATMKELPQGTPVSIVQGTGPFYVGILINVFLCVAASASLLSRLSFQLTLFSSMQRWSQLDAAPRVLSTTCARPSAGTSCGASTLSRRSSLSCSTLTLPVLQVVAVFVIGGIHTILSCHTVWYYAIDGYDDPGRGRLCPWSVAIYPLFTALVATLVQSHYAWRLFLVGKRSPWVPAFLMLLTLAQLGAPDPPLPLAAFRALVAD